MTDQHESLPAPATKEERIARVTKFTPEEVEVLKRTIVPQNVTDVELSYFLMVSGQQDLNPFNKEIWCIKGNDNRLMIMTSRDGFLRKAQRDPRYRGIVSACVRENDDFELDLPGGKIRHVVKGTQADRGNPIGAYCMVRLLDQEPHIEWAPWETFNKGMATWKSHPDLMIQKVAEAHALKKALGFTGLDVAEDFIEHNGKAIATIPPPVKAQRLTPVQMKQAKKELKDGTVTIEEIQEQMPTLHPDQLDELRGLTQPITLQTSAE